MSQQHVQCEFHVVCVDLFMAMFHLNLSISFLQYMPRSIVRAHIDGHNRAPTAFVAQ
jgi:hypothetical protein